MKSSQKEKDKYHITTYVWNLSYKSTYPQNKNRLTDRENRLTVAKGERRERRKGVGVWD